MFKVEIWQATVKYSPQDSKSMTAIVEVTIAISLKSLLVCKLRMKLIIQPVKLLQVHWTIKIMLLTFINSLSCAGELGL